MNFELYFNFKSKEEKISKLDRAKRIIICLPMSMLQFICRLPL